MQILMGVVVAVLSFLSLHYIRAVVRLKKVEIQLEESFQENFPDEEVRLGGLARYRRYHHLMKTEESEALLQEAEKWIKRARFKFSLALSIILMWAICHIWMYGIL